MQILNEAAAEILIYEPIVDDGSWFPGITPKAFHQALSKLRDRDVSLRINSPGGSVFAANTMFRLLQEHQHEVQVKIDGLAASCATFVACAGTRVVMAAGSRYMIHNPWTVAMGDDDELHKIADIVKGMKEDLIGVYHDRSGLSHDEIRQLMAAETWFTPEQAVERGFVDEALSDKPRVENRFDLSRFRNAPRDWPGTEPTPPGLAAKRALLVAAGV